LNQNGKESGYISFSYDITNEQSIPGPKIAPKATILSGISELGKPHTLLIRGSISVRRYDGVGGRGGCKKQMPSCNGLDKSSKFALSRKGADLLLVFHGNEWRYTCECT
jgi:hypothetical protein